MSQAPYWYSSVLYVLLLCTASAKGVQAQVIPDSTLSAESSSVNISNNNGISTYSITGGASRGTNLFHSFDQFSVMADDIAFFANVDTVENIIGRVTGNSISNLNGVIRANGNANLFLLNPTGILMGPNARLEIGGSFFASTGQGLQFENDFVYDSLASQAPPLLTVSAPIGLVMGNAPGRIEIMGQSDTTSQSLVVDPGQSLTLVGGDISVIESQLTAAGGRIQLASVANNADIPIAPSTQGFDINLDAVEQFGPIQISDQSILDASGPAGGYIFLQGQTVHLDNQSALLSDTLGDLNGHAIQIIADHFSLENGSYIGAATFGSGEGSHINITAMQDAKLIGTNIFNFKNLQTFLALGLRQISDRQIGGIFTSTVGSGQAGNISLNSRTIQIDQGVAVSADSLGAGDSGDIEIEAIDTLRVRGSGITTNSLVSGIPLFDQNGIATGLSTIGIPAGASGNISIDVSQFIVEEGATISTATVSDQNSGDILISARDSVILRDFFKPIPFPTTITTATVGGNGDGGNIYIETGRLVVQDGSEIAASTGSPTFQGTIPFGGAAGSLFINATESIDVIGDELNIIPVGNNPIRVHPSNIESATFSDSSAGVIQLITPRLTVQDGGRISSATFGDGPGGEVYIESEEITVSGAGGVANEFISGIFASSGAPAQDCLIDGCIDPSDPIAAFPVFGAGGTININTTALNIQKDAEISVGSFSFGSAGDLEVIADMIQLNDQGSLAATTTTTQGGNINVASNILMLDNSSITTTSRSGNGGNLTFNIQDVLLLRNGSLISTDAGTVGAGGNGGNISLNLPNGFVIAVPNENSDIRANAFEGNGGNVNVTARSLLGIAFRPGVLDTPLSDITASSQFGNSGTVTIDEINSDVVQTDINLPVETAPTTLAQGCRAQGAGVGSFVSTGRGGLPTNPADVLSADAIWQDLEPISEYNADRGAPTASGQSHSAWEEPFVEAQSWRRTDEGKVMLMAQLLDPVSTLPQGNTC